MIDLDGIKTNERDLENWIRQLLNEFSKIVTSRSKLSIDQHAQRNRIMPQGTPRPGRLDLSYTPYLCDSLINMSPSSLIRHEATMKGFKGLLISIT